MSLLRENALLVILVLSSVALILFVIRLICSKRSATEITQDKSGLWQYHKGTQFRRKAAYAARLAGDIDFSDGTKKKPPKESRKERAKKKVVAVLTFHGDIRAREHANLARLVDEIEINAHRIEEVVVCVTSAGGFVSQYGHAFSQLVRVRKLDLALTVCIDTIAASGGYLMSVPASKILAAPFAVVGSVGVMAFVPNIRNLLIKNDIDPRTFTSGRFKRTVSLTDRATPEEIAHFQSQLDAIHRMFCQAVAEYRPAIKLDEVSTGDHWSAKQSLELGLGLVDELCTSHEYILRRNRTTDVVYLTHRKNFFEEGLRLFSSSVAEQVSEQLFSFSNTNVFIRGGFG